MDTKIQNGFLTLADISGYTSFMAKTELEHSHEILSDFLNLLIDKLTPMYNLAEVEGDAVFVFAPDSRFSRGETLLELIENTYYDFRKHRDIMQARTNCTCRACQSIPSLDLKFITHFGSYALQQVAGSVKPVGSDVNLAHRLLKNKVTETTGWNGYALFSQPAVDKLGVQLNDVVRITENYEHLGDTEISNIDLHKSFAFLDKQKIIRITEEDADLQSTRVFNISPAALWQLLNDTSIRSQWMAGTHWTKGERPKGRTGVGATNHCEHGSGKSMEKILDWKPFTYFTKVMGSKPLMIYITQVLEPDGGMTKLHILLKLKTPLPRWVRKKLAAVVAKKFMKLEECENNLETLIGKEGTSDKAA